MGKPEGARFSIAGVVVAAGGAGVTVGGVVVTEGMAVAEGVSSSGTGLAVLLGRGVAVGEVDSEPEEQPPASRRTPAAQRKCLADRNQRV